MCMPEPFDICQNSLCIIFKIASIVEILYLWQVFQQNRVFNYLCAILYLSVGHESKSIVRFDFEKHRIGRCCILVV